MAATVTYTDGRPHVELTARDCYAGMCAAVNAGCWRHAELLARVLLRDARPSIPRKWLAQAAGVVAHAESHPETERSTPE